jgi:hypothetical protein
MVRSECSSPSEDNIQNVRGTKSNILGRPTQGSFPLTTQKKRFCPVADVLNATILHQKDVLNH